MNLSLADIVLVVTGSTQGVGRAVALEAAKNGAEAIVITGRDKARGAAVAAEVEALGARASPTTFGQVLVSGAIRNVRDEPITPPPVRVALLNAEGEEIGDVLIAVQGGPIGPGAVRGFAALADDPHARAADIDVAFDLDTPMPPPAVPRRTEPLRPVTPAPPPVTAPAIEAEPIREVEATPIKGLRPLDSGPGEAVSASHG